MASTFFDGSSPLVVAHRGFARDFPENTLPAFQAALDLGADILETDAHVSADGVAMLTHDPGLWRIAGRSGLVETFSREKLQSIDLGGAVMPTLAEALREFPHVRFSIDIKHRRAIPAVVAAVRQADALSRVVLASFSARRLAETATKLPGVATLGSTPHISQAYLASLVGLSTAANRALKGIHGLFMPPTAYGIDLFAPHFLDYAKAQGVTLGVWTINDPDQILSYWNKGVRAVITDRTDLAVAVREEWAQPR